MSIATLFVAGLAYTAFSILGVGFALLAGAQRLGLLRTETPGSHLVCAIALAVYWSALFVTLVVAVPLKFTAVTVGAKLALDTVLIAGGTFLARRELRDLAASAARGGVPAVLGLAVVLGTWAFLQFPQVLDSGQLRWTQALITDGGTAKPSAMLGFSGLIAFLGRWFAELPLVATAAALKPVLFALALGTAWHAADCLAARHKLLAALLFAALMGLSEFGLRGVVFLGKDSIYGVLFSVAFLAALCRPEPARHAAELVLYFAAAAATGVIALPFMLAAYALWLAFAPRAERAWSTVPALYLGALPIVPTALAGFFRAEIAAVFAAYLALGLAGWAFVKLRGAPAAALAGRVAFALDRVRALVPLALALPSSFLFPVDLPIQGWRNQDGSVVVERRQPLDGQTDIFGYLFEHPVQTWTVAAGIVAALLLPFTPLGRARAGIAAVSAMPFAVLLAALVRAHADIPVLSNFHVWDIVKDVPLWYGGALFALLAVVLVEVAASRLPVRRLGATTLALFGMILIGAAADRMHFYEYTRPVHYTRTGGYADRDMAVASDIVWRKLRGHVVFFDMSLRISRYYFYSFQMYEVTASRLDLAWLANATFPEGVSIAVFARHDKYPELRTFAAARKASLSRLADLENGDGGLFRIDFDSRARPDISEGEPRASFVSGAHEEERVASLRFRWIEPEAEIAITLRAGGRGCLMLEFFAARPAPARQIVTIVAPESASVAVDIAQGTMAAPVRAEIPVVAANGATRVRLTASIPEARFSNDARRIVYGLRVPLGIAVSETCGK